MSTTISVPTKEKIKLTESLIVKGFKNEPVLMKMINFENNLVALQGKSENHVIRLKPQYVFCYDKEVYQGLQEAFNLNDTELLAQVWQRAKPIVSPN